MSLWRQVCSLAFNFTAFWNHVRNTSSPNRFSSALASGCGAVVYGFTAAMGNWDALLSHCLANHVE